MKAWWKNPRMMAQMTVLTFFMLSQIILSFFLKNPNRIEIVRLIGWGLLYFSAFLGWAPILEFKRKGGIPKRKSYMQTSKLVTTGIYSILRHPQYFAGILLSVALMLITQHWIIILLGMPPIPILYSDMKIEEKNNLKKFGRAYKDYMKKVPRTNFLLGVWRLQKK